MDTGVGQKGVVIEMDLADLLEHKKSIDSSSSGPVKSKSSKRVWSEQQKAIFEEFKTGKGNVAVIARAGCAKTTTAIEAIKYAPETRILMTAFNKVIAEELKTKIYKGEAKTLHSLGMSMITRHRPVKIEKSIGYERAEAVTKAWTKQFSDDEEACKWINSETWAIKKMVETVKNCAPFADSIYDVEDAAISMGMLGLFPSRSQKYGTKYDKNGFIIGREEMTPIKDIVFRLVLDVLEEQVFEAIEGKGVMKIDFEDMIWLPVRLGWMSKWYELVVTDEVQDLNQTQIELATGVCNGRMIMIGDPMQAIYLFRGADSRGIERMTKQLDAKTMGLTTTYRCPKAVVKLANTLVEDFYAHEDAPEGLVEKIYQDEMIKMATEGDFILSRNNAPLVGVCLRLISAKKRATVRGKAIGETLVKILNRVEGRKKFVNCDDMWVRLKAWEKEEVVEIELAVKTKFTRAKESFIEKEILERTELIADYIGIFHILITEAKNPFKVVQLLNELFTDTSLDKMKDYIICGSVHSVKGNEAERVFVLQWTLKNSPEEERNIAYVAFTRSKNALYLVQKNRPEQKDDDDDGWRIRGEGDSEEGAEDRYEDEWRKEWADGLDV